MALNIRALLYIFILYKNLRRSDAYYTSAHISSLEMVRNRFRSFASGHTGKMAASMVTSILYTDRVYIWEYRLG